LWRLAGLALFLRQEETLGKRPCRSYLVPYDRGARSFDYIIAAVRNHVHWVCHGGGRAWVPDSSADISLSTYFPYGGAI
jgi:hypothetical protein